MTPATRGKTEDRAGEQIAADQISYEDLYQRWERGNWSATALDFSQDAIDWREKFDDFTRAAAKWNYSLFFYGEDSVAQNLSPYIDAAPLEEQKYFLTTQQVDEARHAIFFKRFYEEVIGVEAGSIGSVLAATQPDLTWGFRKVFNRLDRMADELRADRSLPKFAQAIVLYHFVVEATLAQTGQHFIADYLDRMNVLPGFREGLENVSLDEQRHIGFGVRVLADLNRQDPEVKDAVAELLAEVMPYALGVFVPPNWDERYIEVFGETLEGVYASGIRSIESKLRAAGLPLEEMSRALPLPPEFTVEEKAQRSIALLRAGIMGEGSDRPDTGNEAMGMLFDAVLRSVNPRHGLTRPTTIQWMFPDADPWYLRIDNGRSEVACGRAPRADLTFRVTAKDWIDIAARREDPRKALLTGKLRPKGSLMTLYKTQKLFGLF